MGFMNYSLLIYDILNCNLSLKVVTLHYNLIDLQRFLKFED